MISVAQIRVLTSCITLLTFGVPIVEATADLGTISCTTASSLGTDYVNSWGKSFIGEDPSGRYVAQYMYWHDNSRLAWFKANSDSTWELDTYFYNYGDQLGSAYGTAPTGFWDTDLPLPYVDTQESDGPNEKEVTIGSAYAKILISQHVYYYTTHMLRGPANKGLVKIQAQRGRLYPSWCDPSRYAYCSFGCSTSSNFKVVPFSSRYYAPGCRQYWWQWWDTLDQPCS